MKIKLQDYSLISNEKLKFILGSDYEIYIKEGTIIPSEKLALAVYEQCTVIGTALSFREQEQHMNKLIKTNER